MSCILRLPPALLEIALRVKRKKRIVMNRGCNAGNTKMKITLEWEYVLEGTAGRRERLAQATAPPVMPSVTDESEAARESVWFFLEPQEAGAGGYSFPIAEKV